LNIVENNEVKPLYSGLSLPLFGIGNGFENGITLFGNPIRNTALGNNLTAWKSVNFEIIKYAEYKNKGFFDTDIGPWIFIIAGAAAMITAPIVGPSEAKDGTPFVAIGLFSGGLGMLAGGIVWLCVN
jgi:hypothetical protein